MPCNNIQKIKDPGVVDRSETVKEKESQGAQVVNAQCTLL
jgi:hypothetical protein